ncbi:lytic polysaccharide monooxygenase auxiliary activity family 9 protein [Streptomyces jumonjinensis]|uniref:Lytic polysaccharide monooxygenase n=1 Tax=Streptomyces jumonjinensis TaxID=1945 RepID=A0A646KA46_STRJU|nr:lytic polysaccharide monooxygenase [Streptomyces jumonjinensis]MQS98960.1 lytic polysaccharide monooxygenase [Streptomyces jumonjinensis]
MTARRKVSLVAALGIVPLALTTLTAAPAVAHGSMLDPVSRISACFAEGPESPDSAACKALVAAGGTQPLYDWNEVNIGDAAGRHQQIIPDGKLCSVGREKYKGLDAPRADWPSSKLAAGNHTFRWRATAPHRGTLELYITKDGYDATKPLKWSDLEAQPFVKVTDPRLENGSYVFDGKVPAKSGRHLVFSILQRSDSPEAFYTCSDVVFGGAGGGTGSAPVAEAPSDQEIKQGAGSSTVDHGGHGGDSPTEQKANAEHIAQQTSADSDGGSAPEAQNAAAPQEIAGEKLAATGGDSTTSYIAIGGAAALALGAAAMFGTARRRATAGGRSAR